MSFGRALFVGSGIKLGTKPTVSSRLVAGKAAVNRTGSKLRRVSQKGEQREQVQAEASPFVCERCSRCDFVSMDHIQCTSTSPPTTEPSGTGAGVRHRPERVPSTSTCFPRVAACDPAGIEAHIQRHP